jgi:hypothetical protein
MSIAEITENDTRTTRLQALETQVCQARDDLSYAAANADIGYALRATEQLATLLQHTLQELGCLADEVIPR